jgi:hypothetical protein
MKMQKVENYDEIKMLDLEISFKNHSANQMHFSAVHFKLQKKNSNFKSVKKNSYQKIEFSENIFFNNTRIKNSIKINENLYKKKKEKNQSLFAHSLDFHY